MAESNLKKASDGYGYKYTDLAQTNTALEAMGIRYYQYIERIGEDDYVYTVPIINGEEKPPRRGCRVVQATLTGKSNPAQENGSALTYARRYSLWMAFGLATTDDDAQLLTSDEVVLEAVNYIKKRNKDYQLGICEHYGLKDIGKMTHEQAEDFLSKVKEMNVRGGK